MSKNIYQKIERGEVSICQTCIHRLVCRAIDNQPCAECNHYQNAADVAPVVRCEECRYYQNAKLNKKGFLICPASGMEITEDDYCSYGERKEDDT